MGRIFRSPSDDSTEATLRAMHITNELDTYYEYGMGWLRTILFSSVAIMITSAYELHTGNSIWGGTVEYTIDKLYTWAIGLVD